jgi:hypothetical protein
MTGMHVLATLGVSTRMSYLAATIGISNSFPNRLFPQRPLPTHSGQYTSRACEYFWATVPYFARDPQRIEDLDSGGPDPEAGACRYGILR